MSPLAAYALPHLIASSHCSGGAGTRAATQVLLPGLPFGQRHDCAPVNVPPCAAMVLS